jgi:peroxiredoxin Q/BCP
MHSRNYLLVLVLMVVFSLVAVGADAPAVPTEGGPAPAFTLPGQDGASVSLEQFRGKWVVLYFYPKDFTSGCTLQAQNFQRDIQKYEGKNAVIVGVSVDSVGSHKDFCTKEGLSFKVLADTERKVSSAYGSVMTHEGTDYAARNTFLIDPAGVVRKVYLKVKPTGHSAEVLADLTTLQAAK